MASFKGHLYAGTLNRDDWDLGLDPNRGTEVWRFDGTNWEIVVDSGFGSPNRNWGTRRLFPWNGVLYAGTMNASRGAEVWQTEDGVNWEQIAREGFGTGTNDSIRAMAVYNDLLYLGTTNRDRGGQIHAWDGSSWTKIVDSGITTKGNGVISDLVPWRGLLYVFTWNQRGFQIFTYDGSTFTQIVGPGTSNPAGLAKKTNEAVLDAIVYNDRLYVGTEDYAYGADLYRTDDGVNFVRVVKNGWGDIDQTYVWQMEVFGGHLYLGTLRGASKTGMGGTQIYRMDPQENFVELVGPKGLLHKPGFGNPDNYGTRSLAVYNGKLYIGTAQNIFFPSDYMGTQVWELAE